MAIKDYNTNSTVQGLRGLSYMEGDPDYNKKQYYQQQGYTWEKLSKENPELALKWSSQNVPDNEDQLAYYNSAVEYMDYQDRLSQSAQEMNANPTTYAEIVQRKSTRDLLSSMNNAPMEAYNAGYGESKYDTEYDVPVKAFEDLQDVRAENQSGLAKLGVSTLKAGVLAATTFLDGTAGFIYGLGSSIANADLNRMNANAFSDALQNMNEYMEEVAPMYKSKEYEEKPWYENLGTVELWADGVIKNMGFTAGALISGSGWTKALRAMPAIANSTRAQMAIGSLMSGLNEGRIEANQVYHDLKDSETARLNDAYVRYLKSIENDPDYRQKADEAYQQKLEMEQGIEDRASQAGIQDAIANTVLLSLTNYSTWGRMFTRDWMSNKNILFQNGKYLWDRNTYKGAAAEVGKDMIIEGPVEEMGQETLSKFSKYNNTIESPTYYNDVFQKAKTDDKTVETLDALSDAFVATYCNPDEWEQAFAGSATALLGVGVAGRSNSNNNENIAKRKPVSWQGGIIGKMLAVGRDNAEGEEMVSALNKAHDRISSQVGYFQRMKVLADDMDGYIEAEDKFNYENSKDNMLGNDIEAYIRAGRLQDLKDLVNQDYENMSDANLEDIAKNFSPEGGTEWRNADGTYKSDTEEGRKEMRNTLMKRRDKLNRLIDAYEASYNTIRNESIAKGFTEDELMNLTWLYWKAMAFNERFQDTKETNKEAINNIIKGIDNNLKAYEGLDLNNGQSDDAKRKKLLENVKTSLTAMLDADNVQSLPRDLHSGKLKEMLLEDKDLKQQSGLNDIDYKNAVESIYDMTRMAASVRSFNSKLQEYLLKPDELRNENAQREKTEQRKRKQDKQNEDQNNVSKSTVGSLVSSVLNNENTVDGLKDKAGSSTEAQDKVAKAEEILQARSSIINQASKLNLSEEEQEALEKVLNETAKRAQRAEDLYNTDNEFFIDHSILDGTSIPVEHREEVLNKIKTKADEAIEKALQARKDFESYVQKQDERTADIASAVNDEQAKQDAEREAAAYKSKDGNTPAPAAGENKHISETTLPDSKISSPDTDFNSLYAKVFEITLQGVVNGKHMLIIHKDPAVKEYEDYENQYYSKYKVSPKNFRSFYDIYDDIAKMYKNLTEVIPKSVIHDLIDSKRNTDTYSSVIGNLTALYNIATEGNYNGKESFKQAIMKSDDYRALKAKVGKEGKEYLVHAVKNLWDNIGTKKQKPESMPADNEVSQQTAEDAVHVNGVQPIRSTLKESPFISDESKQIPSEKYESGTMHKYWKPNTALLPFGGKNEKGNFTPMFRRGDSEEASIKYLMDNYNFSKEQAIRAVAVGNYLEAKGAYQRVDNGFVKPGMQVFFAVDPQLNEKAGDFVVLITDGNNVLGDLGSIKDYSTNNSLGLVDFIKKAQELYNANSQNTYYKLPSTYSTTVEEILEGQLPYLQDGTFNTIEDVADGRKVTFSRDENKVPVAEINGMKFKFITPFISKDTWNTEFGKNLAKSIDSLFSSKEDQDIFDKLKEINSFIADDLCIWSNKDGVNIYLKKINGDTKPIYKGPLDESVKNLIYEALEGQQVIIDNNFSYPEICYVNLSVGAVPVSSWFTMNPIDTQGKPYEFTGVKQEVKPVDTQSVSDDNIVEVTSGDKIYNVNMTSYEITDANGKSVDDPYNVIKAIAVIKTARAFREGNSNYYQTMWGLFDIVNQKFVSQGTVNTVKTSTNTAEQQSQETPAVETVNKEGLADSFVTSVKELRNIYPEELKDIPDSFIDTIWKKEPKKTPAKQLLQKVLDGYNKDSDIDFLRESSEESSEISLKEKDWFAKSFPQFSNNDRLKIVENLQFQGRKVWGMFKKGVVILNDKAAQGTLYHEAFHAVTQALLSPEEKNELYFEAKQRYNTDKLRELEENMAEDFRRYMQIAESPYTGKAVKLYRWLKHIVKSFLGKEHLIDKMFYDIASGKFKTREVLNPKNNTLFSSEIADEIQKEMDEIKAKAIADGTFMKAPNGNPTNLTERQWLQVRTKAFKKWFGDWLGVNKFNLDAIDYSKVDVEEVDKPWKDNPTKSNKTIRIYIKGQHEKGYFELVKDYEFGQYSVHFKTAKPGAKYNSPTTMESTKENRKTLFEELVKAIPEGATVSTWGSLSEDGVRGLDNVGRGMTKIGEREVSLKSDGSNIKIPIYQKGEGVSKVVDENDEPLVVYHTTRYLKNSNFTTFNTNIEGHPTFIYFSSSKDLSRSYLSAEDYFKEGSDNATKACFLNIRKPLYAQGSKYIQREVPKEMQNFKGEKFKAPLWADTEVSVDKKYAEKVYTDFLLKYPQADMELIKEEGVYDAAQILLSDEEFAEYNEKVEEYIKKNNPQALYKTGSTRDIEEAFRDTSIDSIKFASIIDYGGGFGNAEEVSDIYAVRNSNQVKSAIDNVGTFSNEEDDIYLREVEEEMDEIKAKAIADGTFMKAPNGNPTNLTEFQWLLVRTKAFKEWFGDWEDDAENASKVVDENGEPLVVYHGTPNKGFTKFEQKPTKRYTGEGFYFTADKEYAEVYRRESRQREIAENSGIYEVFLNIKNPIKNGTPLGEDDYFIMETDVVHVSKKLLTYDGHDGIYDKNRNLEIVVPYPNQIKSAIDNVGTFSSEEDDIYLREVEEDVVNNYSNFATKGGCQRHIDRTINSMSATKTVKDKRWKEFIKTMSAVGVLIKGTYNTRAKKYVITDFAVMDNYTATRENWSDLTEEEKQYAEANNITERKYALMPQKNRESFWYCGGF